MTRALATVRKIEELNPIPGADRIEVATVGGWKVVVKKGEFKVGDLAVYFEIDSWIPHDLAPFLTKTERFYNNVKGNRLKTVRLKGQLSQGLLLPLTQDIHVKFAETFEHSYEARYLEEGDDVTEILNIQKWEKPIHASLAGVAKGNFPAGVPKTDQERIQNLKEKLPDYLNDEWEITEKLDGSSCTFYLDLDGVFHVCSRNLDLVETEDNAFWKAARKYKVEEKLREGNDLEVAIQGELLAWNIQGNQYGLAEGEVRFYAFDVYDVRNGHYLFPDERKCYLNDIDIPMVPVIRLGKLPGETVDELLTYAEGQSKLNNSEREGFVYKSMTKRGVSFKTISNKWLEINE